MTVDFNTCCPPDCYDCEEVFFCDNFFVFGAALYWKACEDGLEGPTNVTSFTDLPWSVATPFLGNNCNADFSTPTTFFDFEQNDNEPNFKWNWGFKVGIGYETFCSAWDIQAWYTWLHSKTSRDGNSDEDGVGGDFINWKLRYNTVDVVIGKRLFKGQCVTLRPFIGGRGAWIHQTLTASTSAFVDISNAAGATCFDDLEIVVDQNDTEKFNGGGPELGLEGEWKWGCGFSLYGTGSVAVLYGNYHVNFDDFNDFAGFSTTVKDKPCGRLTVWDLIFGIRWRTDWLSMDLSWEHHRYDDFNKMGGGGDLNLDGGTFEIAVHF